MAREYFDALDKWLFKFARGLLERGGSPERLARGFAAGILGAFFPAAPLRFVAAGLAALFFRGNKAACLIIPAIAGIFELQTIGRAEAAFGAMVWRSGALQLSEAAAALCSANESWTWEHPVDSLLAQYGALQTLTVETALGLGAAALITGFAAGAASYPIFLIAASFFYEAKFRTKQYLAMTDHTKSLPFVIRPAARALALDDVAVRTLYCGKKHCFANCDSVRLLIDGGEAYPEMLAAIAAARETLVLETYILRDDKFGRLFAQALQSAAQRGVRTRLLCDGVGSIGLPAEYFAKLVDAGVSVRIFHPLWSFWRGGVGFLQRRDHRKIIVADSAVSLIGGLNIADEYAAVADGGGGWRDTHVRLNGAEAARILVGIFEETWRKAEPVRPRTHHLPAAMAVSNATVIKEQRVAFPSAAAERERDTSTHVPIQILSNRELLMRLGIKRAYLRAIRAAQRYILIENAFFTPDRDVLRALYAAVRRGVTVGVVVAMKHDVRVAALASRALYDELLAHGVRLFEYPISMMHSKVAVIDDCWAIVSSYNLNHRSLIHDLEVGVRLFDGLFAVALRDQILIDIGKCGELTKELHRARPWNIALTESVCYQFRYWL